MSRPSFTAQLRAIDDADLDTYQFRMVMHVWRVGDCFESLRTTAEKCNMSLGKASEVKQWLLDNGWFEYVTVGKKVAVRLCSLNEQRSPHEQECSPHEQVQPVNVHHVNAILNEPLLNEPLLNEGSDNSQEQSPVIQLADYFSELTAIYWNGSSPKFEHEWKRPLEALLKKAGGVERAKEIITQAHKLMTTGEKIYHISNPSSIQVTAVNLLNGAATKQNGNGHYGNYWLEVEREIKKYGRRSTKKWEGATAKVIRKCGGYSVLCNKDFPEAEQAFKIAFNDLEIA